MYRSYANNFVDNFRGYANIEAFNNGDIVMASKKELPFSLEWLRDNLDFNPETGVFHWTKPGYGRTVGKPIGEKARAGQYLMMRVQGDIVYAHRLAWFYHHGEWPKAVIDHIDGNRANNAIVNLREATHAQNAARRQTTRLIGPSRGVVPHQAGYVARIHHKGVRHYLGYFTDPEEAKAAYEAKAKEIHGEFAHAPEPKHDRGDWMNAKECEACGSTNGLRWHRTTLGTPRGMLCINCWGFVLMHGDDPKHIRDYAKKLIEYVQRLDVPEDVLPPYRPDQAVGASPPVLEPD